MADEPVRVLQVITSLAGGAGRHAVDLARHLDRGRYQVELAFGPGYPLDGMLAAFGVPHHHLRWKRSLDPLATGLGAVDLLRLLQERRYDVLHAHCSLAGVLGRVLGAFRRVPCVFFTVHEFASRDHQPGWRRRLALAIERGMDPFTHRYFVSTRIFKDLLVTKRIASEEKVTVIPHGIEAAALPSCEDRRTARELMGLEEDDLAVGTASRLEPQKGLSHLVEAFPRVVAAEPRARLVVLGDGPLRPALEEQAARLRLGSRVLFLGWRDDLGRLLPGLDLFCLASLWESFGYALLEAMAAAVPVVATRVGGVAEVVDDGREGRLVPPADGVALAAAILALLGDPAGRRALGESGRTKVSSQFTLEGMASAYERSYEASLRERRRAATR